MECLSSLVSVTMAGECARRGGGGDIYPEPRHSASLGQKLKMKVTQIEKNCPRSVAFLSKTSLTPFAAMKQKKKEGGTLLVK